MHMSHDVLWVEQGQMCNVMNAWANVRSAVRAHTYRLETQHIVQNRQIMGSEIPQHVGVSLKEAEVCSDPISIVNASESPGLHEMAQLLHGWIVEECVPNHEYASPAVSK